VAIDVVDRLAMVITSTIAGGQPNSGLVVSDTTDGRLGSTAQLDGAALDLVVGNGTGYALGCDGGCIDVVDLSDPFEPYVTGRLDLPVRVHSLRLSRDRLYGFNEELIAAMEIDRGMLRLGGLSAIEDPPGYLRRLYDLTTADSDGDALLYLATDLGVLVVRDLSQERTMGRTLFLPLLRSFR
jgi:hypothetical protein